MACFDRADAGSLPSGAAFSKNMALALASAKDGNTRAIMWRAGDAFAFWELANRVLYLSGTVEAFNAGFPNLLAGEIRPIMAKNTLRSFSIHCDRPVLHAALPGLLSRAKVIEARNVFLKGTPGHALPDTENFKVVPIDGAFLDTKNQNSIAVLDEILKMWPSRERYLERGFGFASIEGGLPVSWCTAEFVSHSMCGIGIETDESRQGRGHATAAASAFVAEARRRGATPHWCTGEKNAQSLRVAQKTGFEALERETGWECELKK